MKLNINGALVKKQAISMSHLLHKIEKFQKSYPDSYVILNETDQCLEIFEYHKELDQGFLSGSDLLGMKMQIISALFGSYDTAEVRCAIRDTVVRRLSRRGNMVSIDAISTTIEVPANTELLHEEWVMDRGSVVFFATQATGAFNTPLPPGIKSMSAPLKFCTVYDIIEFPDGSRTVIEPKHMRPLRH